MMAAVCDIRPDAPIVEGLLQSVDCNVRSLVEIGYGALNGPGSQLSFVLTGLLTLYVASLGLRLMLGRGQLQIGDLTMVAVKIGVVLALATSWPTYQQVVFDTLFRGPQEIAGSILAARQTGAGSVMSDNPFTALQIVYDELQVQAAYFAERSNAVTSPFVGGNPFGAFALNISAMMLLMCSLGVVLAVKVVLGLLLALGPFFVAFLLFDSTRGLFEGWLRASLALALAPLVAVLSLVVQLSLMEPHIQRLVELRAIGQIDLAPAVAILVLNLIGVGVCLAGLVAVGMIARGVRIPSSGNRAAGKEMPSVAWAETRQQSVPATSPMTVALSEMRSRAASVASAAAALERRDQRLAFEPALLAPPRSLPAPRSAETFAVNGQERLGQSYRRTSAPSRAASSARRDQ